MKILGVIPARLGSTRLKDKPLQDICGKPMIWWVCERAKSAKEIDDIVVATDSQKIVDICNTYGIKSVLTSPAHDTPTSRIHEVSTKINADYYAFISGDEPLIDPIAIDTIATEARKAQSDGVNAMKKIKNPAEAIDATNIKVVTNTDGYLLYTSRCPIPFPKGRLDMDYMKFVGIGIFSKNALKIFNETPRSKLEKTEECDLLRFLDRGLKIKMIEVQSDSLSIDTYKDLEFARERIKQTIGEGLL